MMSFLPAPKDLNDIAFLHQLEAQSRWYFKSLSKLKGGTLRIDENGCSLRFKADPAKEKIHDEVIVPEITAPAGNGRILLLNSRVWNDIYTSLFNRKPKNFHANPQYVIVQSNSKEAIDPLVTQIAGYLPGVGKWFDRDFLKFDHDEYKFTENKTIYHKFNVEDTVSVELNSKLEFDEFEDRDAFKAFTFSYAEIKFTKPVSVYYALKIYSHVENFFNFIFSQPYAAHVFKLDDNSNSKKQLERRYLYHVNANKYKVRSDNKYDNSNILFKFDDIIDLDAVDNIFIQWVINYEQIREVTEAMTLLKTTSLSEELRFTTLINALESLHIRYFDKKLQSEADFRKKVAGILGLIKEEDREFVEQRLQGGNNASLRERLKEVFELSVSLGLEELPKNLRRKIVPTRNYYTHGNPTLKNQILDYSQLYSVNSYLGRCLKIFILRILKVSDEDLKGIVKASPQFRTYYRDEPAKYLPHMY
jgi:hypothetical protein